MFTLYIEHGIKDFDTWKAAFDRDPADRVGSGVMAYRICRPAGDERAVLIELDFAEEAQAQALLNTLREKVWTMPADMTGMEGMPSTRIFEELESKTL